MATRASPANTSFGVPIITLASPLVSLQFRQYWPRNIIAPKVSSTFVKVRREVNAALRHSPQFL